MLQFFLDPAERAISRKFRRPEFSCGKIQRREAHTIPNLRQGRKEIIFFRPQQRIRGRTRRDYSRHFAPHQFRANLLFGQPRIFHLFADGHLETFANEFANVAFRRVVGNSAHGHRDALLLVPRGQRDLQLFGGHNRILKEKLVKIAEAEK